MESTCSMGELQPLQNRWATPRRGWYVGPYWGRPCILFFGPRCLDLHADVWKRSGARATDWRGPRASRVIKMKRALLSRPSPARPGLFELPYELRDQIFRELCGKEIAAIRLVSVDWEVASRPFFAEEFLHRTVFWLTASHLKLLKQLLRKFAPHMRNIYIASDHFTVRGLRAALQQKRSYSATEPTSAQRPRPSRKAIGYQGQGWACLGESWIPYPKVPYSTNFFWTFFYSVMSQTWLHWTGLDRRTLSKIARDYPQCRVEAVELKYDMWQLYKNRNQYGRSAPEYAIELALFCADENVLWDPSYASHVRTVVESAAAQRGHRSNLQYPDNEQ